MQDTKKRQNTVRIDGYLKENNLELIKDAAGNEVIRGSIIVSVDEINSHKIQFYVPKLTRAGEESKDFKGLFELLPEKTITIASFLKANATASFAVAQNASTKVWVMARFEEYASKVGERERSIITLKGLRAGFKTLDERNPFRPRAEFTVDAYINGLEREVDSKGENTDRVKLEALIPAYNNIVYKVVFMAPETILDRYAIEDTVTLVGEVVSIQEKKVIENSNSGFFDFVSGTNAPQYETRFIRERRILRGSPNPIHQGEEGCISKEYIKEALANREMRMEANGSKSSTRTISSAAAAAPAAPAPSVVSTRIDDFDF